MICQSRASIYLIYMISGKGGKRDEKIFYLYNK
nr:MAG TPA: hypothetical protein [Caudoviricetes sp.]